MENYIKIKGTKKQVKKKSFELITLGYIVYSEPYNDKTWYLTAKLPD